VYLYQIIHYSMQQVFLWSQNRNPSSRQTRSITLVIGHNPFFINPIVTFDVQTEVQGKPDLQINLLALPLTNYTGPVMKRPIGLILSAIVLSLSALFLLLMTALSIFTGIFASHQPTTAMPHFVTYLFVALSVIYAILAAWAILTVIGILRLRSWGRYSILIIGGGFAVVGVFAVFGVILSRSTFSTLPTRQPAVDPHLMSIVFIFIAAFYLLIAAMGIWWLIYFNLRSIRELFSNPAMILPSSATNGGRFSRTPTAIKIIGGLFLFSTVTCLLCAFLPFPAFLLGFIFPPAAAHVLYLCFAALTAAMGYGLLRLKEPARLLTIAFLILGCCNIFLAALPWYQGQFHLYMTQFTASMPTLPGQPQIPFLFSQALVLFSCISGLILYGFLFWLLHRHRAAFHTQEPPEPMLEA
jgi:hypothetical protein